MNRFRARIQARISETNPENLFYAENPEIPTGKTCVATAYSESLGVVLLPCPYYRQRKADNHQEEKRCYCVRFGFSEPKQSFLERPCQINLKSSTESL